MGGARKNASMAYDHRKQQKRDVFLEAQKERRTVHVAALMDICHIKSAELEQKFQKDKVRVALRGDIVKDDSCSHAVFTEKIRLHFR